MLNAAIVGLGRWGRRLVESVQDGGTPRGGHIRFVHGVTRTPATAAAFAEREGLTLSDDYPAALADPAIGAVVLATPHSQHAAQVAAAADAGKPVFVEKPFTLTRASAAQAVAAARAAGIVLAAGHNRRFLPATAMVKRLIEAGTLGKILHMEGNFSGPWGFDYRAGMWRADRSESPAGGMTAMGIHVIDAFIHLGGPLASAQAWSQRQAVAAELDDTTSALLRFAGGATAYVSTLMATPRQWRLQVFGTQGWAHMRDHDVLDLCDADGKVRTQTFDPIDMERAELEAFAAAVAGGPAYPVPLDEVVNGVAALAAIVQSAAAGGTEVATA